jgi:hypothetical protein
MCFAMCFLFWDRQAAALFIAAFSRKGYWHLSKILATQTGMTHEWIASQGLISVRDLWLKAHGCRLFACSSIVNRPARTCLCRARQTGPHAGGGVGAGG